MTLQAQVYRGIEVFKKINGREPKVLVVGFLARNILMKEVDPRAVDILVVCGLEVCVNPNEKGAQFVLQ